MTCTKNIENPRSPILSDRRRKALCARVGRATAKAPYAPTTDQVKISQGPSTPLTHQKITRKTPTAKVRSIATEVSPS